MQTLLGTKRKVRKLNTITKSMWGKTGRITKIKNDSPTKYYLEFWVPNRMTGLWLTEKQMEEV
jgi:hypothetical protein